MPIDFVTLDTAAHAMDQRAQELEAIAALLEAAAEGKRLDLGTRQLLGFGVMLGSIASELRKAEQDLRGMQQSISA